MDTKYIEDKCINTVLMDLPTSRVKGCTIPNDDGSYTIILNSRLSAYQQRATYLHEVSHIVNEDFAKYDVNEIELERH